MLRELERTVQVPRPEPDWGALAHAHDRVVWLYLLKRRVPPDRAQDLKQEVWIALIQKWRSGELTYIQMPGVALWQARLLVRRGPGGRDIPTDNVLELADKWRERQGESEALILDRAELQRALTIVARSPKTTRSVFQHTYRGPGMSPEQVAATVGISVQHLRKILSKLRKALRGSV
jgi:DNA-directed RNA polymerase specialized sigma24 family protein